MNNSFITDYRIDHRVVNGAIKPFDVEILLDKIGALPINSIYELLGFLVAWRATA